MKKIALLLLLGIFIISCSSINLTRKTLGVRLGANTGGIIEPMKDPDATTSATVDAITGATKTAALIGIRQEFGVNKLNFETGLDLAMFAQSFSYQDYVQNYVGKRNIAFQQIRVPLTWNYNTTMPLMSSVGLSVKLGMATGLTMAKQIDESGTVPAYSFTNWDAGGLFGVAFTPQNLKSGFLTFYIDMYRGSKIYKDFYVTGADYGNHSQMNFGVQLNLK